MMVIGLYTGQKIDTVDWKSSKILSCSKFWPILKIKVYIILVITLCYEIVDS